MSLHTIISNKLVSLMESYKNKDTRTLIFLKGFPADAYMLLKREGYSGLYKDIWLNSRGYVDVAKLEENKKELLLNFLIMNDKIIWGFYEEFIALTNTISEIKKQFNGNILVVDNNLFNKYYPLDIHENILKNLISYFRNENMEIDCEIEAYLNYYSGADSFSNEEIGLSLINRHDDEDIKIIEFYEKVNIQVGMPRQDYRSYLAQSVELFAIKKALQGGQAVSDIQIVVDDDREKSYISPLINLLSITNSRYNVSINERFNDLTGKNGDKYLNILQRYWGKDKTFRPLKFYKNPDISNELMEISQGHVINDIISQCKYAINNSAEFSDIFITAPTGAGKSLLFQIPSIYMAEEYRAVTIVITPLIALMRDQVEQMAQERGVEFVTFINSDISFEEKEKRINGIKNGEYYVVYLSPELFLANSIESLIGEDKRIALLVIDEAHLVTTWGRDFRADYWYLGGYIDKLRKTKRTCYQFPVLCLTATAVYMGNEDTVNDTIKSLNLNKPKLYLGNVKRNNISFNIKTIDKTIIKGGLDDFKIQKTKEHIIHCIDNKTKCIVYCPYSSQVEDIFNSLDDDYKKYVGKYYGSFDKYEKVESQNKFKYGDYLVMISTKAFGMGVDIKEIEQVYHFAPTGNLADYVQEIGRVARDPKMQGTAITDFTPRDMKYVRMLYGLSGMKQYQLKEMIRKLYSIYKDKESRNLLISPEAFSYLFDEDELENRVKSGLLLISKDFESKYLFPVINVRPKGLFTKNYVNVPASIENEFIKDYSSYAKLMEDNTRRIIPSFNRNGDTSVYNSGNIYEIDMAGLWERYFNYYTFAQFKRNFFEGELFKYQSDEKLSARVNLVINFEYDFDTVCEKLKEYANRLSTIFSRFKSQGRIFTKSDFKEHFKQLFDGIIKNNELPNIILDIFVADFSQNEGFNINSDKLKFVQERKAHNREELVYRVMNSNFSLLRNYLFRLISQCKPTNGENKFSAYISVTHNDKKPELIYLAVMLELFGLASYEIIGGRNTEIFVRINDPNKLRRVTFSNYSNSILTEIERKRDRSQSVLIGFMLSELSDAKRWDVIEDYFLGRDDSVSTKLNLAK